MHQPLAPSSVIPLPAPPDGATLVAFNVGPRDDLYFVYALRALDYRTPDNGFATFAKVTPETPQQYLVRSLRASTSPSDVRHGAVVDVHINQEPFNIHNVQPAGDELLLVCSRSMYRGPNDYDRNGHVYGRDGAFHREILLGDGIQTVQATASGEIWVSYFDEGIFGNFGWDDTVGASGLIAWSATGERLYCFEPPPEQGPIDDCYALNVASDRDVWCYYYSDFPLVHIHDRKAVNSWSVPVHGAHAFATADSQLLLAGTYDNRSALSFLSLGADGVAHLVRSFSLSVDGERAIDLDNAVGRGSKLYALGERAVYVVDVNVDEDLDLLSHDHPS